MQIRVIFFVMWSFIRNKCFVLTLNSICVWQCQLLRLCVWTLPCKCFYVYTQHCTVCACLRECTVFACFDCVLRRHPACCDCQGELALADRMRANLLVRLCVCPCVFPCIMSLRVHVYLDQAFLLQRVMALRGRDRLKDEVGEVQWKPQREERNEDKRRQYCFRSFMAIKLID